MAAVAVAAPAPPPPTAPAEVVATASGLLALLSEPEPVLRSAALTRLLGCVDVLWHEVAESLPHLEAIAEDPDEPERARRTAAAVASRVFFHLEEPAQALRLALEGGEENFDVVGDRTSAYVECLVGAAIDSYVKRKRGSEGDGGAAEEGKGADDSDGDDEDGDADDAGLDEEKVDRVVRLVFERCYVDRRYGHALGVAFEAREMSRVREVLERACSDPGSSPTEAQAALRYALDASMSLIAAKSFRDQVLTVVAERLAGIYGGATAAVAAGGGEGELSSAAREAAVALCQCHQLLGNPKPVSEIVASLLEGTDDEALLGLQLSFDIVDTGDQRFADLVAEGLTTKGGAGGTAPSSSVLGDTAANAGSVEVSADESAAPAAPAPASESSVEAVDAPFAAPSAPLAGRTDEMKSRLSNALRVLTGGFASELALSFLHKNSDSDRLVMENLKKALEERGASQKSVLHNCAVAAHAYLNAGTTNDSFLRDHLDWMRKASNW